MSTYIMCTLCGETVKGFYRNPHPGKGWCQCIAKETRITLDRPWLNTATHSYGKNFDFDTIKPNHKQYRAEDYRDAVVEAINILEQTGMSPDKLNGMLMLIKARIDSLVRQIDKHPHKGNIWSDQDTLILKIYGELKAMQS